MTTTESLFIAELDSLGYPFRAVGRTEAEARKALRKEWTKQVRSLPFQPVYKWTELEDEVWVWEATPGFARMGS